MKKADENNKIDEEISANAVMGEPQTTFDLINKFGTYEIQPTADTDNEFPAIAQGIKRKDKI